MDVDVGLQRGVRSLITLLTIRCWSQWLYIYTPTAYHKQLRDCGQLELLYSIHHTPLAVLMSQQDRHILQYNELSSEDIIDRPTVAERDVMFVCRSGPL